MIKNLRKRHLQIWMAWAFLIPVAIFFAWKAIARQESQKLLQDDTLLELPVMVQQWDRENYQVRLKTDQPNTVYQLAWINKKALTFPTATLYFAKRESFKVDQSLLVGRIETRGTYHFTLDSNFKQYRESGAQLVLYDFIHQQIIDTLNFNR